VAPQSTLPPPAQARLQLVVNTGQRSDVFPLYDDSVVNVGRDSDNVIRIDDASVSRRHLELHASEDGAFVVDLGSSNGTLLVRNNPSRDEEAGPGTAHRLPPHQPVPLRIGEAVRVGPAMIFLQVKTRTSQSQLRAVRLDGGPLPVLVDPEMKKAYELLSRAAQSDVSVLITGETGAGKEMMAETVHRRSRRAHAPYLQLNCAALPETLLESELFGHEKGAFTGAHATKVGLLEATEGGTVFLDEIGELALGTQAKLLRVLEERTLLRVGGVKARRINVRFVTATNRDLVRESRDGRFRSDLYYRISGLVVRIPPLRDRTSEIEPLARYFLREFCRRLEQPEPPLSGEALQVLLGYEFPGNVRELRNVIERAALVAGRDPIRPEHILLDPPPSSESIDSEPDALTEVKSRPSLNSPRGASLTPREVSLAPRATSLTPRNPSFAAPRSHGVRSSSLEDPRSPGRFSQGPSAGRAPAQPIPPSSASSPSLRPSLASSSATRNSGAPTDADLDRAAELDEERARLQRALDECAGNQTRAAKLLGISRRQLIARIEFWQLPRPKKR
jgi:two-component system, NtrC family, response regulator AtoC